MAEDENVSKDSLLEELRAHPHREPLGALALDVLGRQAEGRTQFVGRDHVQKRAEELGVERARAGSSLANALDVLERGPKSERERALVASLAVLGLEDAIAREPDGADARIERAVRHAVWLETSTDVPWLGALAREAAGPLEERLPRELAQQVLDAAVGRDRARARTRARAIALVTALAASRAEGARDALLGLAAHGGLDPVVASAIGAASGASVRQAGPPEITLEGAILPRRFGGFRAVIRWITGWALLAAIAAALRAVLGRRAEVRLALAGRRLEIHESIRALGLPTRERSSILDLGELRSASREPRHRGLLLYAGALSLSVGVLVGGYVLVDGARGGEYALAALGAALFAAGVAVDAGAERLARRGGRRAAVELAFADGRVLRLSADDAPATRFLEALRERLPG